MAGQLPGLRVVIRESVLGFLFWSMFWQLTPSVYFYPLNEMGVTGYEIAALAWFSPLLLGLPGLRSLLRTKSMLSLIRLTTLGCAFAAHNAPSTLSRLLITCLGNGTVFLSFTVSIFSLSVHVRRATFWGLILGYFAAISSRIWCSTFNPLWFTTPSNFICCAIILIATLDKIFSGDDWVLDQPNAAPISQPKASTNWISASAGTASLLFLTHWIFSEVSVITRWVLTPYPTPGPQPLPFGLPVLICLTVGFFLGFNYNLVTSVFWWNFGILCFVGLYVLSSWLGYLCGLGLALFSMSLYIFMFDAFMANGQAPPVRSMGIFSLTFLASVIFNIFTVAYNFVYEFGGEHVRERTDIQIGAIVALIGLAIWRNKSLVKHKSSHSVEVHGSIREIGGVIRTCLLLFVLLGVIGFAYRISTKEQRDPPRSRPDTIRAAVFTCHFGFNNMGWSNALDVIDFFNKTDADVIAMLESDTSKPFLGNNDLTAIAGERLGMYTDFGAPTRDHCWGVNLLSRFPILYSEHHLLPSPHGEIAPAIRAGLDVGEGRVVDVVITHMGIEEDDLDRKLQAKGLSEILKRSADSAIFLGYITSAPFSRDYTQLTVTGRMTDIDTTDSERWCEYILYRGLERLGYARVTHAQLSDTELQMATFQLPPPGADKERLSAMNHAKKAVITDPSKVSPGIRFPELFGEHGKGHRSYLSTHVYHMSTPKYFLPVTTSK